MLKRYRGHRPVHALYCDLRFAADNTVHDRLARRGLIAEHGTSDAAAHRRSRQCTRSADVRAAGLKRGGAADWPRSPVGALDQLREQTYAYARDLADFVSPSAIAV